MGARTRTRLGRLASPTRVDRLRPGPSICSATTRVRAGRDSRPPHLVLLLVVTCLLLPACSNAESNKQSSWSLDREKLNAAFAGYEDVIPDFDQLRTVVVATEDRIVFERYYGSDPDTYRVVNSITKSVVSTSIGIALHEGLIGSLDDTLAELLPKYADANFTQSANWVRDILTPPESAPGGRFLYSDGTAHLLAAVLEKATGTSALNFARSRLFGPLDIDTRPGFHPAAREKPQAKDLADYQDAGFAWPRDPQGVSTGWWASSFDRATW